MRRATLSLIVIFGLLLLNGCSTPPKHQFNFHSSDVYKVWPAQKQTGLHQRGDRVKNNNPDRGVVDKEPIVHDSFHIDHISPAIIISLFHKVN